MKKKLNSFVKFLLIYSGILLAVVIGVWTLLYCFIKDYEQGLPASAMNNIIETINGNGLDTFLDEVTIDGGEFNSPEVTRAYLKEKLALGEISYKKMNGQYSDDTPVYIIYQKETPIARLNLKSGGRNTFRFNLWKADSLMINEEVKNPDLTTLTVTVPTGSVVSINGVTLNDDQIEEKDIIFEPCTKVSDFVDPPTLLRYKISGVISSPAPAVDVTYNDAVIACESDSSFNYTGSYPADETLLANMRETITNHAESYGKYLINRGSLATLKQFMIGDANVIISDIPAIWAYMTTHNFTYTFKNESVSNLVKYSDDCFSCDVYFDLYVDWTSGNKTYNTDITYTYVKKDGKWYIAEFRIN